jgi:adenylosuccinate lyase
MYNSINPIDGRYYEKTKNLSQYFSEAALIKYRIAVEIKYFLALTAIPLEQLKGWRKEDTNLLLDKMNHLTEADILKVKEIEKTTNHDVKAVEYFLKDYFQEQGLESYSEFIHFGLTSQDINNTSFPKMIQDAFALVLLPKSEEILQKIKDYALLWKGIPMLAHTHGQPASPTTFGKEMAVFAERLETQLLALKEIKLYAKFGGATGNFNAHHVAYPNIDWVKFANAFCQETLKIPRAQTTTQIAPYDDHANLFQALSRFNTVLLDFTRDIWMYISMNYLKQKSIDKEVGSSAMPHKVNPIDFENAEGNLGLANALFHFLADKLPVSRLQRDLTDSTVIRNIGVPFGYSLIAYTSLLKGLSKIDLNAKKLSDDLENNWAVIAEAIQVILRREGYPQPYEALKELTRGKSTVQKEDLHSFIEGLSITPSLKEELKSITPHNYTGIYGAP